MSTPDHATFDVSAHGYSIFAHTLADMTWPEVEAAGAAGTPLLVPVAVIEQHGYHLPLATDTYGAHLLCVLIRQRMAERGVRVLIAPPFYYGLNTTTGMFPGSLVIKPETMAALLTETLENYASWGLRRQFIVNHHGDPEHNRVIVDSILAVRSRGVQATYLLGGMIQTFVDAAYESTFKRPLPLPPEAVIRAGESERTRDARIRLTRSRGIDVHAGERETSLIMRWHPAALPSGIDLQSIQAVPDTLREFHEAESTGRWRELSPWGHIGDPAAATVENAELYEFEAADMADALSRYLEESAEQR